MNIIVKFFHELMNPHCSHCIQLRNAELERVELEREINDVCKTCESLKIQLAVVNQQNEKLLNSILVKPEPVIEEINTNKQIIQTRHTPWSVRRNKLELDSKLKLQSKAETDTAKSKAAVPDSVIKLEKEIGIG